MSNVGGTRFGWRRGPTGSGTDHPQNGAGQLLELVGAAPARLDRGQAEVADLHRQVLMEENIWGGREVTEDSLLLNLPEAKRGTGFVDPVCLLGTDYRISCTIRHTVL